MIPKQTGLKKNPQASIRKRGIYMNWNPYRTKKEQSKVGSRLRSFSHANDRERAPKECPECEPFEARSQLL